MVSVLVVDDTLVDRHLTGGLLAKDGSLQIQFAENGRQAIDVLNQGGIDLVITDLQMPVMDGLQLVETASLRFPNIPIILITAHGSEQLAALALAKGAASYVPKTHLAQNLLESVHEVLAIAHHDDRFETLFGSASRAEFEFHFSSDLTWLVPFIDFVQQLLSNVGFASESSRVRIGVALEHALRNAAIHGNLGFRPEDAITPATIEERISLPEYASRQIHVIVEVNSQSAKFQITDEGMGFELASVPEKGDANSFRTSSGRGLNLMVNLMDEVHFTPPGNQVTLIKFAR